MRVLVINAGSSSVKYQLIDAGTGDRLGGGVVEEITDRADAFERMVGDLAGAEVDAVGHRVVQGGEAFSSPSFGSRMKIFRRSSVASAPCRDKGGSISILSLSSAAALSPNS